MTDPERHYVETAVAALDDQAVELRACLDVLKFESDVQKCRVAENRYLRLSEKMEKAA